MDSEDIMGLAIISIVIQAVIACLFWSPWTTGPYLLCIAILAVFLDSRCVQRDQKGEWMRVNPFLSFLLCPIWMWIEVFASLTPKPWREKGKRISDLRFVKPKIVYPSGEANARSLSQARMSCENEMQRGLSLVDQGG